MARLPDEQWDMIEDSINKKKIANSARNHKSHCGKGGSVKFPSDYLSKKELKAMNGEVKSYRMNEPVKWNVFKTYPKDIQIMYVKSLREKFNAPNIAIATAMGISNPTFCKLMREIGLGLGKGASGEGKKWMHTEEYTKFWKWWGKIEESPVDTETAEESPIDICIPSDCTWSNESTYSSYGTNEGFKEVCTPTSGRLDFNCNANEALDAVRTILNNADVYIHIEWTIKNRN